MGSCLQGSKKSSVSNIFSSTSIPSEFRIIQAIAPSVELSMKDPSMLTFKDGCYKRQRRYVFWMFRDGWAQISCIQGQRRRRYSVDSTRSLHREQRGSATIFHLYLILYRLRSWERWGGHWSFMYVLGPWASILTSFTKRAKLTRDSTASKENQPIGRLSIRIQKRIANQAEASSSSSISERLVSR